MKFRKWSKIILAFFLVWGMMFLVFNSGKGDSFFDSETLLCNLKWTFVSAFGIVISLVVTDYISQSKKSSVKIRSSKAKEN